MDQIERKMREFHEEMSRLQVDLETKREIRGLREEVATLRTEVEKLNTMVALLAATVAQTPPQQRPQQQYQQGYPGYQHVAVVTPTIGAVRNSGHQSQFQQRPQQPFQQHYPQQPRQQAPQQSGPRDRVQKTPQFDSIPMKYAELLPVLLKKNLVQTRAPPPVPERLPTGYRLDLSCAFHQGAPGHDIEKCYGIKGAVQKLVQAGILSFEGSSPIVQDQGTCSVVVDVLSPTH